MSLAGTAVEPVTLATAGFWPGGWVWPAGFVQLAVGLAVADRLCCVLKFPEARVGHLGGQGKAVIGERRIRLRTALQVRAPGQRRGGRAAAATSAVMMASSRTDGLIGLVLLHWRSEAWRMSTSAVAR